MHARWLCCDALVLSALLACAAGFQLQQVVKSVEPPATQVSYFAYVQLDKAGSTTIRYVGEQRAKLRGWPPPCQVNIHRLKDCGYQPDGALLLARWGFCATISSPCKYIVMLREPVDRLVSAYNYFCRGCQDDRKYCGHQFTPASCPNQTIVEFARKYNNLYTRKFSAPPSDPPSTKERPNLKLAGGDYKTNPGLTDAGFIEHVSEDDFKGALSHLRQESVLVLALEDPERFQKLAAFTGDHIGFRSVNTSVRENSFATEYVPTQKEMTEIARLNDFDVRLYRALLGKIRLDRQYAALDDALESA
eukprot:TRINITY_DN10873_c0_g1_i1.p1 TRINITY_DN10873_c0_g1~~TRINITY_DN10873_c0_g1_i1.p1  ORF type:complete len:305 (+),score=30.73 TRINITY_DN10873_c0_g1_i1:83-997(+)